MSDRKARTQLTDLPGMDARQAPRGVSFSLGHFSFGQAKEKYLALPGSVKAVALDVDLRSSASRTGCAPTGFATAEPLGSEALAPQEIQGLRD